MKLYTQFKKTCDKYPDNIALVNANRKITYSDSLSIINELSTFLNDQEKSCIIYLDKNEYSVLWQLAINKSKNVFTSIDISTPINRVIDIIEQNESKWIICSPAINFSNINGSHLKYSSPLFNIWETSYNRTYSDITHIYFSSGSTGKPKGIYLNDNPIPEVVLEQAKIIELSPESNFAWLLSPSFDASLSDIYSTLFSGATLHICSFTQNKTKTLLEYFNNNRISHSDISPSVLPLLEPTAFKSLKSVIFGGEVGNEGVIHKWANHINMFNAYGPTETTICSSFKKVDNDWTADNIGKPLEGVEYIISDDNELHIAGNHVCIGYNQDILNDKFYFIDSKKVYKTGDLVKKENDEYFFIGRKDRQFKNNGVLISPEEIEKSLLKLGCKESLCKKEDKFILFYVGDLSISDIRKHLLNSFNKNMIPSIIKQVPSLPKNINGKIKI